MAELIVFAVVLVKSCKCDLLVIWACVKSTLYLCVYLFRLKEVPSCKKYFLCNGSGQPSLETFRKSLLKLILWRNEGYILISGLC